MQYENNLRKNVFYREKKKGFGFQKAFSKRYIWKKGGVVLYSGQYVPRLISVNNHTFIIKTLNTTNKTDHIITHIWWSANNKFQLWLQEENLSARTSAEPDPALSLTLIRQ